MSDTIPAVEKLRAIEREIGYRRLVYPRRVADKKMTQKQADWQLRVMEAIRDDYLPLAKAESLL
jgi:hypothetical protein